MLSIYDFAVIALYFLYLITVGLAFRRRNKNTSDYFRGGGILPWWLTGASMWMTTFSAWTFTGAAGKIYENGPYVLCLYYSLVPSFVCVFIWTCYRFRRMRVVTPAEAIRLRFGPVSQQFYTWIRLPFMLYLSGVNLNSVGVFMSAVFNVNLNVVLVVLGTLVTAVSLLGGALSVVASDFVQMFLVVILVLVISVLTLFRPEIGGIHGLLQQVPGVYYHWSDVARPDFIALWTFSLALNNFMSYNSVDQSAKYLMSASDRDARRMVLIPLVGMILGPLLWMIPPMACRIIHPNLAAEFPTLEHPHETAFLVSAHEVLPQGMLGLLICGIFAATLSNLDAGLNQGAGIFVRNFYLPILNPTCNEKRLLQVGKICTGLFGCICIFFALIINRYRTLPLFEFVNQINISLLLPLTVPLCLGLRIKNTPGWSTWSTVTVGLIASCFINVYGTAATLQQLFPSLAPFSPEETRIIPNIITVVGLVSICSGWFLFTSLFYGYTSKEYRDSVEDFFVRLKTPLHATEQTREQVRDSVVGLIGRFVGLFGAAVCLLALFPNTLGGRFLFVLCGGLMSLAGLAIHFAGTPSAETKADQALT